MITVGLNSFSPYGFTQHIAFLEQLAGKFLSYDNGIGFIKCRLRIPLLKRESEHLEKSGIDQQTLTDECLSPVGQLEFGTAEVRGQNDIWKFFRTRSSLIPQPSP